MRTLGRLFVIGVLFLRTASFGQSSQQPERREPQKLESTPPEVRVLPANQKSDRSEEGYLLPGADPENHLLLPFMKHLAQDQEQFWTSPKHLDKTGAATFAGFLGFTGLLVGGDSWISKQVPDKPDQLKRSQNISNYGAYALIGAGGGAYLLGKIKSNDRMSETGLLSGESALNSTAISYLFKVISQRPRPMQDNGNGTFFHGGYSFPSEHSAVAWSIASVVAHEYPGPLTKFFAYGLASAVTVTRVTGKQHFASDAFVGSALGWYLGRQIYRAHHDPQLGGAPWGELVEAKEKGSRNPANMGSPYVPLDSWVYPAFNRLIAGGYMRSSILGMRPWTRMQCAQLLEEAEPLPYDDVGGEDGKIRQALVDEFRDETARLDGAANVGISLDSVYERTMGISGSPLQDGYHFGQTVINDQGRPYAEGVNVVSGATAHAVAGPFSFYVRGEYQHAPSVPGISDQARQAIQSADGLPTAPPGTATPSIDKINLLEGYVGLQVSGWQFTFGKQQLWWGPGAGGSMLFSTNAEPITMLQIKRVLPSPLPGVLRRLGLFQYDFMLGRLSGHHWVCCTPNFIGSWTHPLGDQPFIAGQKFSLKPTANLELGVAATTVVGGNGVPFTTENFLRSLFSTSSVGVPGSSSDPGDRRGEFDFAYRIPKLRDWLTFYADAFTDDQVNPWFAWDKSAVSAGVYLPKIPLITKLDLRAEGVFTDIPGGGPVVQHGFFYANGRFRSGYTNDGNLIGDWIGRQGQGAEAWSNYWLNPKSKIQFHFRHQKVSQQFIPNGGSLTDVGASSDLWVGSTLSLSASVQYERWAFPVLSIAPQTNVTGALQVTFWPRWRKIASGN